MKVGDMVTDSGWDKGPIGIIIKIIKRQPDEKGRDRSRVSVLVNEYIQETSAYCIKVIK